METAESSFQEQVAHGGPIYLPDLIGPLTRVSEFEDSIVEELQSLRVELCLDLSQVSADDILVDDLKIFSDEELVDKAMKVAFQDEEQMENSSQVPAELADMRGDASGVSNSQSACLPDTGKESNMSMSDVTRPLAENDNAVNSEKLAANNTVKRKQRGRRKADSGVSDESGTLAEESEADSSGKLDDENTKKIKKRGRTFDRNTRAAELEGSYIAKVEQLAEVKRKQDEDKAAARLHSFNGGCKVNEGSSSFSATAGKMTSLRFITSTTKVKPSITNDYVALSYPEVVLCVEIYHQKRNWIKTQEFLVLGKQRLTELRDQIYCLYMFYKPLFLFPQTQEFLVLGKQRLTELRDQIYCLTDLLMEKAKTHDPSGYFLIEDVFCNDMRDPSAIDYSQPIFEWLKDSNDEALEKWESIMTGNLSQKDRTTLFSNVKPYKPPRFKAVEMHKVRFSDLWFRLGSGYLYCHQGDCKHVLVIRDMRLLHPDDSQNRAAYPLLTFKLKTRPNKCNVCNIYRARKVTVDDKWAGHNPCYFCDDCYYLLHYSKEGTLLYDDFKVYDYYH